MIRDGVSVCVCARAQVIQAVLRGPDVTARSNLRPLAMAQATPRVFWNVVSAPAWHAALRWLACAVPRAMRPTAVPCGKLESLRSCHELRRALLFWQVRHCNVGTHKGFFAAFREMLPDPARPPPPLSFFV